MGTHDLQPVKLHLIRKWHFPCKELRAPSLGISARYNLCSLWDSPHCWISMRYPKGLYCCLERQSWAVSAHPLLPVSQSCSSETNSFFHLPFLAEIPVEAPVLCISRQVQPQLCLGLPHLYWLYPVKPQEAPSFWKTSITELCPFDFLLPPAGSVFLVKCIFLIAPVIMVSFPETNDIGSVQVLSPLSSLHWCGCWVCCMCRVHCSCPQVQNKYCCVISQSGFFVA